MVEPDNFRKLSSYENLVVRILKDKKNASAADIAKVLYPSEANLRPKTSQVSVVLRRLEKKGVVKHVGKEGRKAFFSVYEKPGLEKIEKQPVLLPIIVPMEKIPKPELPKGRYEDIILGIIKSKKETSLGAEDNFR